MLFEEYIQENGYRNQPFDFMGYKVYRDGVALDTMGMGEHWYYDVVGEDGAVEYHVSAVYEEDGTGVISEVNSNMVSVNLQNAAPTAVNLISPENETVITLTSTNVQGTDLGIFWSNSSDADGEQVEYTLELCVEEYDDCLDSTMTGTNLFLGYDEMYSWIADSVNAKAGSDITKAEVLMPHGVIRELGEFEIGLDLGHDVHASVKLAVVGLQNAAGVTDDGSILEEIEETEVETAVVDELEDQDKELLAEDAATKS